MKENNTTNPKSTRSHFLKLNFFICTRPAHSFNTVSAQVKTSVKKNYVYMCVCVNYIGHFPITGKNTPYLQLKGGKL